MANHVKHSPETKMLCYYLYWFCRRSEKNRTRALLTGKDIERITGVPANTVNKIGRLII